MNWPDNMLALLPGVKAGRQPGVWHSRCPVHDDQHPSMRIVVGETGVLMLKCYVCKARYGAKEFLAHVCRETQTQPWQWCRPPDPAREGQTTRKTKMPRQIVRAFDYVDEHGELRFQICRFASGVPKSMPRRPSTSADPRDRIEAFPDGSEWVWEKPIAGIDGLLYRLPDLLERPDHPVCITEGEPDADTLEALGFVAVTNAFGADAWTSDHAALLQGRRCVVFEDNDQAGRSRTQKVVGSLVVAGAASVRIVRFATLPEHGDVSDFVKPAQGTKHIARAMVIERIKQSTEWKPV